jgi:dinuclear metal center YbgI/SA1388 family protein
MDVGDLVAELERIAPPEYADEMDCDRIGLIIEGRHDVDTVACTLDITPRVIREAVGKGVDLLVAHHTPVWDPVTTIRGRLASLLKEVLVSGLNIYVMHTNFDQAPGGINDTLAGLLDLREVKRMTLGVCGYCPIGREEICRILDAPLLAWGAPSLPGSLAVVGGSGFDPGLIAEAVTLGAGTFLSADLKHAVIRGSPLPLLEAPHYALEAPGMRRLAEEMGWLFIDDPPDVRVWT